jgi:hypothetical protein
MIGPNRPDQGIRRPIRIQRPMSLATPQQLREAATEIRALYARYKVNLHPESAIGKIVNGAESIPHKNGEYLEVTTRDVFDSFPVIDLSEMLRVLENHPKAAEYLRFLVQDSLSTYSEKHSKAKDYLWELRVCSALRRAGLHADLKEPPDVVWTQDDKVTGIACKKIYSDARVEAVVSEGVDQLGRAGPYGILAINLDAYVPQDKTLTVSAVEHAGDWPYRIISDFSGRHDRHFKKYYDRGTLSGVLIGLTHRTKIDRGVEPPAYFMNVAWDVSTSQSLPWEHRRRAQRVGRWLERSPEREAALALRRGGQPNSEQKAL